MATTPAGVEPETNPEVARLLQEQRSVLSERMSSRERRSQLVVGLAFLAASAGVLAVGGTDGFDPWAAVVLLVAYVGAGLIRFEIGPGWTDPTLLVVIPALFIEPPAVVPLLVAAGWLIARLPDYVSGRAHPEGALAALGNGWHAIGPALVFALAVDRGGPRPSDTGWYVLAFAAYVVGDAASGILREWLAQDVRPEMQLRFLAQIYALDALIAPVGLMAALASAREAYAYLLAAPLLAAFAVLSKERGKRMDNALALSESRAQTLEAELAAARTRVEVLGAVSHGLQTPVAGVVAIAGVLARRGPAMPGEAVAQAAGRLESDAVALRQLVRQALDYVRLVDGESLALRPADVDVGAIALEVTERVAVAPPEGIGGSLPTARADAVRVHQMLTALVARAMAAGEGDPATVRVSLRGDAETVEVTVAERGPAPSPEAVAGLLEPPSGALGNLENQGTGIDLYVTAEVARALGGGLEAVPGADGLRWVLRLPAAAAAADV